MKPTWCTPTHQEWGKRHHNLRYLNIRSKSNKLPFFIDTSNLCLQIDAFEGHYLISKPTFHIAFNTMKSSMDPFFFGGCEGEFLFQNGEK
jgi:hypothetical protein